MRKREEIRNRFSPRASLDGATRFFLVGIGGAGMSALARMLAHRGFEVRGSDSHRSPETGRLLAEGIEVVIGHTASSIGPGDAVVLTDAIDIDRSPEYAAAVELGRPVVRRSVCLGWLLQSKRVIAVTGTHGKTTTTAMIGAGLIAAGKEPFVMVGASIPQWSGPVVEGTGDLAVVEACEAYDSFHDLDPSIVVLTNLELDHVDFHGNYENLRASMLDFVRKLPDDGLLIYCEEDPGAKEVAELSGRPSRGYALRDWHGRHLATPGRHNALNAAAAEVAAVAVGADAASAESGIAAFSGAERRLQKLLEGPITVIDDYAHHPTEIEASLCALRSEYPGRRLVVVFQPHLYSRTAPLIAEFAEALSIADNVVLTDIYPAREDPMPGVSAERIVEEVTKPVRYVPSRHLLPIVVARMLQPGDVVVGMGAGNISEFTPALIKELARDDASRPPHVAVLYGGDSAEREVSLHSGREVHQALKRLGYRSERVDVTDVLLRTGDLSRFIGPDRPDVAFLAVHGTHAEDGALQGLLEMLQIPYTGSGIQASAIAMDKQMTKRVLETQGIRVPRGQLLLSPSDEVALTPPVVVKPNAQGSTVGLRFVERPEELRGAIEYAFAFDKSVLVEEWVRGMEISTPVLDGEALVPVEISASGGRYDFERKYTPGATEEVCPARLSPELLQSAREIAVQAHEALGCSGATRTDAIVSEEEIYVLEVNTLPGMTSTSLLPNSARAAGIDFDELCRRQVEDALKRNAAKT